MKEQLKYIVKSLRDFNKCLMDVSKKVKRENNIYCDNDRYFSELKKAWILWSKKEKNNK